MPELVQQRAVVGRTTVWKQNQVNLTRNSHRRAKRPRPLAWSRPEIVDDAAVGHRARTHLRHLTTDGGLHIGGWEVRVESRRAHERERVGPGGFAGPEPQVLPH